MVYVDSRQRGEDEFQSLVNENISQNVWPFRACSSSPL